MIPRPARRANGLTAPPEPRSRTPRAIASRRAQTGAKAGKSIEAGGGAAVALSPAPAGTVTGGTLTTVAPKALPVAGRRRSSERVAAVTRTRTAAEMTPAERSWAELRPGIMQALFVSWCFAALYWKDIEYPEGPTLVIGALLVVLALRAAFLRPRHLPLLLAAFLPFNREFSYVVAPGTNMTNFLFGLNVIAYISSRRQRGFKMRMTPPDWLLVAFISWCLISHTRAIFGHPHAAALDGLLEFKAWANPFFVYFVIRALLKDREDVRALLLIIVVATLLIGFTSWHDGIDRASGSIEKSRIRGVMGQANTMGAFHVYYGVPIFAVFLLEKRTKLRYAALFSYAVVAWSMLYTFSRGAMLAMALGTLVVFVLSRPFTLVITLSSYIFLAASFPFLIPESVVQRMGHTTKGNTLESPAEDGAQLDQSAMERIMMWRAAGKMIRDHPFLGVGLGNFPLYILQYHEIDIEALKRAGKHAPTDAHNAYILTAGEMGYPGATFLVLLLLSLIGRAFFTYWRAAEPIDRIVCLGFLGSAVGVMASSMFGSRLSDECLVGNWWILAAMVSYVGQVKRWGQPRPAVVRQ